MLDPARIPAKDFPLIILSDHSSGPIEWIIKLRTKGFYNHAMLTRRLGYFASQALKYAEIPIEKYMRRGYRLKFIEVMGLTPAQRKMIIASIQKKLSMPWWKNRYDFLGIIGQAIGIPKFNVPWLDYCSEDVADHLQAIIDYIEGDLFEAISMFPRHGSPEDLNTYFKQWPNVFRVYGRWDSDE